MNVRSRIALLSSVTLISLLALVAPAAATQVSDPNDVAGKLDIKTLTGTKADASAPLKITIVTYTNFAKDLLKESGNNRIYILFNTDSDPSAEFRGEIFESGGELHLDISGKHSSFEPLPVHHPNGHTLRTVIPGAAPMNPKGTVRIAVGSVFVNGSTCSTPCRDRAPNGGWLAVP